MMTPPLRMEERVRLFTVLGIRFWDAAFDVPITQPLHVHAWLTGIAAPLRATRAASGSYSFHSLPGRRAAEFPGDAENPEDLGPVQEWVISVEDPAGHYLPEVFSLTLPLGYRGEFLSATPGSLPASAGRAYLFSAPGRPVPPGAIAIRVDLEEQLTELPAAWAVLRATIDGRERIGIADEDGRVLLLAPMPEVASLGMGSPPGLGQGAPGTQRWPVTLRVASEPAALRYPFDDVAVVPVAWQRRPSVRSILDEQDPVAVITDEDDPAVSEWTDEIRYGEELVLRTRRSDDTLASSVWITAGASIP